MLVHHLDRLVAMKMSLRLFSTCDSLCHVNVLLSCKIQLRFCVIFDDLILVKLLVCRVKHLFLLNFLLVYLFNLIICG